MYCCPQHPLELVRNASDENKLLLWAASTTPPGYPEAEIQAEIAHSSDGAGARTTDFAAFWVNVTRTEKCTASTDYMRHQRWLDIHIKPAKISL